MAARLPQKGRCIACHNSYAQLWDHWKKNHLHLRFPNQRLAEMGFTSCDVCGQACTTAYGVKTHKAKAGCNKRQEVQLPQPPQTLQNAIQTVYQSNPRRRQASRTPSPAARRAMPRARIQTYSPSPTRYRPPCNTNNQLDSLLSS